MIASVNSRLSKRHGAGKEKGPLSGRQYKQWVTSKFLKTFSKLSEA